MAEVETDPKTQRIEAWALLVRAFAWPVVALIAIYGFGEGRYAA